jgi:hypothetical protein
VIYSEKKQLTLALRGGVSYSFMHIYTRLLRTILRAKVIEMLLSCVLLVRCFLKLLSSVH